MLLTFQVNLEIYKGAVYHKTFLTLWVDIASTLPLLCFTVEILESGGREEAQFQCVCIFKSVETGK